MHHRTDTEESAVFKPLAVAVGLGCAALSLGANAYQYGEYAGETLERLITDYLAAIAAPPASPAPAN